MKISSAKIIPLGKYATPVISRLTLFGSMFFGTVIVPLKPGFFGIRSSNVAWNIRYWLRWLSQPWAYSARRHHRDTLGYSHTWKSRGDELLILSGCPHFLVRLPISKFGVAIPILPIGCSSPLERSRIVAQVYGPAPLQLQHFQG